MAWLNRLVILAVALLASGTARAVDYDAACLAAEDLQAAFGEAYPHGAETLAVLEAARDHGGDAASARLAREALLDNPLLDFGRLLVIRRSVKHLGLVANWESNSSLPMSGFDNELMLLDVRPDGALRPLYRPEKDVFLGDVDLHFDADRLLFSMPGANGRWQLHELALADKTVRELPLIREPDVDNYDACYLPDGNLLFTSTAPFVGVPCVTGSSHVSNIYRFDRDTGAIRRLTFEQDHDWCPTVLNNGRVLYLRWEYSDIPHFASRILFHMNPDGTGQMEYYGSNSYWPNALFYARPIPGHPTKFCAIVGGHHDVKRMGELVVFDPAKGRHEADGVIQRIPGRGKAVAPILKDGLVGDSWPKFLHPFPLSEKYFLVAAKPTPESLWGIYLADVFDNLTLIKEVPGQALLEPVPLRKTPRPPVIADKVDLRRDDAVVFLSDVYAGDGLKGVPRGTVRALRLFTYHFAYHGMGGQINRIGLDGPWDIKRVLGTVPVEKDGSACFRVPANTPISVQPLDKDGQALQLMRSWMTAMPGEVLSCAGCHEKQNQASTFGALAAARKAPAEIKPWYGPVRGFSFRREVQPVLDRHCTGCHDGSDGLPDFGDGPDVHTTAGNDVYNKGSQFPPSYLVLRRYVRNATMESDLHLLPPMEFHASTTELVQRLRKGHHGVQLEPESWDRLITWIDLNAPAHGTWHEIVGKEKVMHQRDRRRAMLAKYAPNRSEDPEAILPTRLFEGAPEPVRNETPDFEAVPPPPETPAEPLDRRTIAFCGQELDLVLLPPGAFVLGPNTGEGDEGPATRVELFEPFWMATTEITNAQFACFDPKHDSRLEHGDFLQFSIEERGYPLNAPEQPVARVSWEHAMAFCDWLSAETGERFTLPTETQWEYGCRAGTATPMWYGDADTNFAAYENLGDHELHEVDTFKPWSLPSGAIHPWRPAMPTVDDGHRVSAPVASFQANPWGLHDMHGNVSEWTRTLYRPYPCTEDDRNTREATGPRVVRGGSWYDRPTRASAATRRPYAPWQPVYNVGFRVIAPAGTEARLRANLASPAQSE